MPTNFFKPQLLGLYLTSALVTPFLLSTTALAGDFTVSNATIVTNGDAGNVLDGDDTLTIETGGSINVGAGQAVLVTGDNNAIINHGTLGTTNDFVFGIEMNDIAGQQSNITNIGEISTTGFGSQAVSLVTDDIFGNSGIITTTGDFANGVRISNNGVITNSGTISTMGSGSSAIFAFFNTSITNSGTASAAGDNTAAITTINSNIITNNGTISSGGDNSRGVSVGSLNTVTNIGIIDVTGVNSIALQGVTGNTFNHSGKIISAQAEAFRFIGAGNTLNLLAPAYIGGIIDSGTDNDVSITTGRSHSNLWTIGGNPASVNIAGPVPWAWNAGTAQFASLDPTALSAASDVLADQVGSLSGLVHMNHGGTGASNMVAADLAVVQYDALITPPITPAPPAPVHQYGGDWWLNGYGSFADHQASGIYNDYTHLNGGIAAGASFMLDENWEGGAFIGYQASNLVVNSRWATSQTIFGQGVVGGLFGTFQADSFFADIALYGGFSFNSSDRFVNDNLAPLGVAHALADYNSFFLAPEVRVGVNVDTGGDWTLTPSATARFSNQWIDGYSETGSNANATIGARQVQVFEGELELAATRAMGAGEMTLRGGIDYRQSLGATTQDVVLLGQTLALPMNTAGTFGGYVGVDFNYDINDKMTLDLSAKGSYAASGYAVSGSIGVGGLF